MSKEIKYLIKELGFLILTGACLYIIFFIVINSNAFDIKNTLIALLGMKNYYILFELLLLISILIAFNKLYRFIRKQPVSRVFLKKNYQYRFKNMIYSICISIMFLVITLILPYIILLWYNVIVIQGYNRYGILFRVLFNVINFLVVALSEELTIRGYLFDVLSDYFTPKVVILVTSLLYAVLHVFSNVGMLSIINILLLGVFLGYITYKSGTVLYAVLIHFLWNYIQVIVLSMPLNGNHGQGIFITTIINRSFILENINGLENSILITIMLSFSLLLMFLLANKSFRKEYKGESNDAKIKPL